MKSKEERKDLKMIRKLKKIDCQEKRLERRVIWKSKAKERKIKVSIFFRILFKICKPVVNIVTNAILIPLAIDKINEKIKDTRLDLTLKNEDIKNDIISLIDSI